RDEAGAATARTGRSGPGALRPRPGPKHRLLHGRRLRGVRPRPRCADRRRRTLRRAAGAVRAQAARGGLRAWYRRVAHGPGGRGARDRGAARAGCGRMSRTHDLTIAVPRGALFAGTVDLLAALGLSIDELRSNDRKLLFEEIGVITMRPSDVPTYVEAGAADLGVTGKDVLLEQAAEHPGEGGREV